MKFVSAPKVLCFYVHEANCLPAEYNPNDPQASHFTQVVWKSSTQVGCAVQSCSGIFDASFGPAKFFVCEYFPQGNIIGEFACVHLFLTQYIRGLTPRVARLQSERAKVNVIPVGRRSHKHPSPTEYSLHFYLCFFCAAGASGMYDVSS